MKNKSSNVWKKIFSTIVFLLMQAAIAGLLIGIISLSTNGDWITTGTTEGDFYVTFASAIVVIDLIVLAIFNLAHHLRKRLDNPSAQ